MRAMTEPACSATSRHPQGGFEAVPEIERISNPVDERTPCQLCFPNSDSLSDIELSEDQLLVGLGPRCDTIHRECSTGPIEYPEKSLGSKTLAERVRDGEAIPASGGDV